MAPRLISYYSLVMRPVVAAFRSRAGRSLRILAAGSVSLALGCAGPASGQPTAASPATTPAQVAVVAVPPSGPTPQAVVSPPAVLLHDSAWDHSTAPVPVSPDDAILGDPLAPVTLVVFSDLQCPFCSRLQATLRALRDRYGEDKLRIVFKHNPLPFHQYAKDTAIAADAVRALGGSRAFRVFTDLAFANQQMLGTNAVDDWARAAGIDLARFHAELQNPIHATRVEQDMALAQRLGARGTPHTFIDGVSIGGAQPIERFSETIDDHLRRAQDLLRSGTPADRVYPELSRQQYQPPSQDEAPAAPAPAPDDTTVHKVPVGIAPVRGPRSALVTVVMFGDFQCPFTARASATVAELLARYPGDVRLVWKDHPLTFHARARAAAIFAREARAQRGDAMFWNAYDKLLASNRNFEDSDLDQYARDLGLNVQRLRNSIKANAFAHQIDDDIALSDKLKASGTPTFFINGRRLVGAQPIERFTRIVDEEIAKARAMVARGVPAAQVYDRIMRDARMPAPEPEPAMDRKTVPAPTAAQPWRGAPGARIVVQQFSDFQCPFCARVEPTIAELQKKYAGRIKIVWRNLPLPFHANAQLAAEAAYEAFKQKGNDGFWRYHDKLFEHQSDPGGLERPALETYASELGLDMVRFRNALDNHTHATAVQADADIAEAAGIIGTPGFVINGFFVSGAQPPSAFEHVIDAILQGRAR